MEPFNETTFVTKAPETHVQYDHTDLTLPPAHVFGPQRWNAASSFDKIRSKLHITSSYPGNETSSTITVQGSAAMLHT